MKKIIYIICTLFFVWGVCACGSSGGGGDDGDDGEDPVVPEVVTPEVSFSLLSDMTGVTDEAVKALIRHIRLYVYDQEAKLTTVKKYTSLADLKALTLKAGSYTVVMLANVEDDANISSENIGSSLTDMAVKLVKETGSSYYKPLGDVLLAKTSVTVGTENITVGLPVRRTLATTTVAIADFSGKVSQAGILVPGVGTSLNLQEGKWSEPGVVFIPMEKKAALQSVRAGETRYYAVSVNIAVVTEEGAAEGSLACNVIARDEDGNVVVSQTLNVPAVSKPNAGISVSVEVKTNTSGGVDMSVKEVTVTDETGKTEEIDPGQVEVKDMEILPDLHPGDWEVGNNEWGDIGEERPPVTDGEVVPGGDPSDWQQGNDERQEIK